MIEILHPEGWAPARGYANGTAATGRQVFVGGQIGWNAAQEFESDDFVLQMTQTLRNVVAVVEAAGGGPDHVTRLTWFVKSKRDYLARQSEVGAAYRSVMGRHFPAMTMVVVADLIEDRALVEIEATAVVPA